MLTKETASGRAKLQGTNFFEAFFYTREGLQRCERKKEGPRRQKA